jgi:glycyl-tRNA synthetase
LALSGPERAATVRAAELAKSDLATSLVVEMTSLQGLMGRRYALAAGEDPAVADALMEQYLPRSAGDAVPATWPGRCLGLADRLDSLVGLFAVGLRPSGTQDPFGLRRAALGVSTILVDADADLDLTDLADLVAETMPVPVPPEARVEVVEFVARRLEGQLRDDGHRPDVVAAVLAVLAARPAAASRAVAALGARVSLASWPVTLTAYARCARIVRGVDRTAIVEGGAEGGAKGGAEGAVVEEAALTEPAERELARAVAAVRRDLSGLGGLGDPGPGSPEAVLDALEALASPINAFFDSVMVMAEDAATRRNRLAIVGAVADLPRGFADFSLLEGF